MEPVTSVTAFVLLHLDGDEDDDAAEILDQLDAEERLALRACRVEPERRLDWLRQHSDHEWTQTELEHIEARASVRLRRELQRRGLWCA